MYCANYGQSLPRSAAFCARCGARVDSGALRSESPKQGRWEYKEVTLPFDADLGYVEVNEGGVFILSNHVESMIKSAEIDLRRAGWQLDESGDPLELLDAGRIAYKIESTGFLGRTKLMKPESVTIRVRRWVA